MHNINRPKRPKRKKKVTNRERAKHLYALNIKIRLFPSSIIDIEKPKETIKLLAFFVVDPLVPS